jgi:(4-O-methyl)-D-glucuronate---lignin esterase
MHRRTCFALACSALASAAVVLSTLGLASEARAQTLPSGKQFPAVSALPACAELPDPLVMLDGRRVTSREQWMSERRPELIALFQHYMYGFLPPKPGQVAGRIERRDRGALEGNATLEEVTITFREPELPPIHLMLVVPNQRSALAPVVLSLNYFGNHTLLRDPTIRLSTAWMPERGAGVVNNRSTEASRGTWTDIWNIEYMISRGYAVATFYNGDVDPDQADERGIQKALNKLGQPGDFGTIAAWAWSLSRAVDYLMTADGIDRSRIIVTGHSRLGKAALLAAALDERIALAIPHQAGSGGSAPSRTAVTPDVPAAASGAPTRKKPETVKQINDAFPHWFHTRFKEFNDQPRRLPFDQHCLVALCAPRPVLFTNGRTDTWINPAGQFEVLRGAAPVYRLLGAGDFAATELPPDGQLLDGKLGFFVRPGGHSLRPEDWKAFLDFADRHWGTPAMPHKAVAAPAQSTGKEGAAAVEVRRWEMHEFELRGRATVENPFRDASLLGEFIAPSGNVIKVEGFYDDGDTWKLRFAPNEEGEWRYRLRGAGVEITHNGRLQCLAPPGSGFIRIHPWNPYAFAYDDGAPFFPMGDTCYGLYDDSPITPELRREYLETRRRQHFNFVRMSVGHSEARSKKDLAYWAWGGTSDKPDLDRFNPAFFRGLDELLCDMQTRGMNVELILLNFYRRPFTDTSLWTAERERLWLRYVLARYASFSNVFLWTLANEYETHPDGKYRLDRPGDVAWAKETAKLVKQLDPYRHPVTVHPVVSSSAKGPSPRDPIDEPWRIGGFFGDGNEIDVLSQQTGQMGEGTTWNEELKCWLGDATHLVASVRADRVFQKPVLNTENGYEYLRGDPPSKKQVHHNDKVRRSSWRIVCAGGYFAAGFHSTLGHSDAWNRIDPANHYSFIVKSEGAADQLKLLYEFFTALPFERMQPFALTGGDAVALADPGRYYVLYLPHGGDISVDLSAAKSKLTSRWFNPRDGEYGAPFAVTPAQQSEFHAPNDLDWVLEIREKSP